MDFCNNLRAYKWLYPKFNDKFYVYTPAINLLKKFLATVELLLKLSKHKKQHGGN